ncbi:hypothetical protein FQZ97_348500 [compost metagenome]
MLDGADRAGRRQGTSGQNCRASVGGGVGGFGALVQAAKGSRHKSAKVFTDSLVTGFQLLDGLGLGRGVAVYGLAELPHATLQVGDGADLFLLTFQHAGLQGGQFLLGGQVNLGPVCALRLQLDAGGEAPPHQASPQPYQ